LKEIPMETSIGVVGIRELGRDGALIDQKVLHESIAVVAAAESEAAAFCKHLGATVGAYMGAAVGMSVGVGAAVTLAHPATWHLFVLGFGLAALVGLAGASGGAFIGKAVAR
jgi:hypothetical protein